MSMEKYKLGFLIDMLKRLRVYYPMQLFYVKINKKKLSYPPMKPETRNKLKKYFREDIEKLEKLINRDLSAWK